MIISSIESVGKYCQFVGRVFSFSGKAKIFLKRTIFEITKLGVDSIPLVMIISLFIGAVITIQMEYNISSPIIPAYSVGLATRDVVLLEFSNAIIGLILAGKVGSNIASEIGTMRVTEQIDALEIMGINSCNYLAMPKIVALVIYMPILVAFSIATSILGGFCVAIFTDIIPLSRYIYGIQAYFVEWYIWYGIIKSLFFGYIIASVSAYFGYYVKGGSLEVGKASTSAVVVSSVMILLLDVLLTKILL